MTDLSPAAQTVLHAYGNCIGGVDAMMGSERRGLVAALRAAADQVVPWQQEPTEESVGPTIDFGYAWALFSKANDVRGKLLAIVAELEGTND